MENENQNPPLDQTQSKIEALRAQNELMDLSIDLAFKERMVALLKNIDSDPQLLLDYLNMHEKRQAQRLKEFVAKTRERELKLKEQMAERRQALEERKQTLKERKFDQERGESDEPAALKRTAPKPSPFKTEGTSKPPVSQPIDPRAAVRTVDSRTTV